MLDEVDSKLVLMCCIIESWKHRETQKSADMSHIIPLGMRMHIKTKGTTQWEEGGRVLAKYRPKNLKCHK